MQSASPENTASHYPRLKELCQRHNIRFKKGLGQNLLLDDNINAIMVRAAELTREDNVIEVGAGLGALTRRLLEGAGRVLAVEIDATFMPCLEQQFGDKEHVRLFRGDILNHDLDALAEEYLPAATRLKMVSNLPYYITTPVLFHFLESPVYFERLVVMTQLEVGERLTAPVGAANYGALSIAARLYAETDIVHRVPASCFLPKPKVDSCIVRFRCRRDPPLPGMDVARTMRVVRAAFGKRRKTLRNTLTGGMLGLAREQAIEALARAGIDAGRRPQTLDWREFAALADAVWGVMND
ncbi:MAG TPA: ribosomal RNA small subunit methyltransferase A [Candidatus Hydrogenedentes bacterium]|nr:ribosomal RNA small subunit methyltransferase A [Candidatus Hydrogenedentota bacterium]